MNTEWHAHARCLGLPTDLFYPGHKNTAGIAQAKSICASCTVRTECLEFALRTEDRTAVMGGLTAVERGRLLATHHYNQAEAIAAVRRKAKHGAPTSS